MLKFLTEFGPLIAFFVGYKNGGIINASIYILIASIVALVITYFYKKEINKVNLFSSILVLISASLTVFSGNAMFIKIKPTILYLFFAFGFFITHYKWNPAIQYILGSSIKLKDYKNWYCLNRRFMWFFIAMAILNELIWRNFDEATWVDFKVFAMLPITLFFVMLQIPFIMKHSQAAE